MKNLNLVLAVLFAGAAHASTSSELSGVYALHTTDCMVGGIRSDAQSPLRVTIRAGESEFSETMTVNTSFAQSGVGEAPIEDVAVGDFTQTMLGGSDLRTTGLYSNDGAKFVYTESDNEAPGLPLRQLRSRIYELNGAALNITQTGDGLPDRVCVLSKVR